MMVTGINSHTLAEVLARSILPRGWRAPAGGGIVVTYSLTSADKHWVVVRVVLLLARVHLVRVLVARFLALVQLVLVLVVLLLALVQLVVVDLALVGLTVLAVGFVVSFGGFGPPR